MSEHSITYFTLQKARLLCDPQEDMCVERRVENLLVRQRAPLPV